MQDRIAYQGITFDDVLLEPGLQRRRAPRRRRPHPAHPQHPPQHPHRLRRRWTPSPRASWPSPWPRRAASASSTRTCPIADQTREVDKVKRSENGIITDPITLPPDETVGTRPADHGAAQHQRRADHRQRLPQGHPHPPRPAVPRPTTTSSIAEVMTKDNLVTAPENTTLEEAERILTENKVEKLLLVDDELQTEGPDHDQGHRQAHQLPQRLQGRARPAAGRGGGRRPRLRAGRRR